MAGTLAEALKNAGVITREEEQHILGAKKSGEQSGIEFNLKHLEQKGIVTDKQNEAQKIPLGVCSHCGQAVKIFRNPKNRNQSLIAFHSYKGQSCPGSQEPPEKRV
jgi:hypothetical protein